MKLLTKLSLFFFSLSAFAGGGNTYQINSTVSKVEWVGKKVTGSHEGTIQLEKGSFVFEDGLIVSGEIIIDMNSIAVTDITDKKSNAKLRGHLVSPDFFGVEAHPTGRLKIVSSHKTEDGKVTLVADLTLKDITKRIEIPLTLVQKENKLVAIGELSIDRTLFDIKYGSGSFFDNLGDKAILDDFSVKFKVAAVKQ